MALLTSLFAGVSGLKNHQEMMDVIGNNISNVNTIGYKSSRVTFSDTFNQFVRAGTSPTDTTGGTNTFQIGLGAKVNSIDRDWNQGTFTTTGTTTDLALQGSGLFILKNNGTTYYARAGAFEFDATGKLVNSENGAVVQGKVANGLGEISSGTTLQDIVVDKNYRLPAIKTSEVSWGGNLKSSSTTIRTDIAELSGNLKQGTTAATFPGGAYSAADDTTYTASTIYDKDGAQYELRTYYTRTVTTGVWTANYEVRNTDGTALATPLTGSTTLTFDSSGTCTNLQGNIVDSSGKIDFIVNYASLTNLNADTNVTNVIDKGESEDDVVGSETIYDSLGSPHTLTVTYKHIDSNRWTWSASVPSADGSLSSDSNGEIYFNTDGTIQSVWQNGSQVTSSPPNPKIVYTPSSGAEVQNIKLDFGKGTSGITQTNLTSQVAALSQDGSPSASLSNMSIDQYGNVVGIFSNGTSKTLAQIMVANFSNLNGLKSTGDNMYSVAANSGDPRVDAPGESSNTTIQSGALEQSNVDLSEEFTNMIVAQRGFQANARVITTADTLLQEITNLIR
jgi:flagellar hook protein FlgE